MCLKRIFILIFSLGLCFFCKGNSDSLFNVLNENIEKRPVFLLKKQQRIEGFRKELIRKKSTVEVFQIQYQLCQEYQSFNYDTAFLEVKNLKKIATTQDEKALTSMQQAFIFLSAGLFREAIDVLRLTDISMMTDDVKATYFFYLARSHFDLGDFYNNDFQNDQTYVQGLTLLDSAIFYAQNYPLQYLSYQGLKTLKKGNIELGISIYQQLIQQPDISTRQLAVEYSTLSSLYRDSQPEKWLEYMIMAAIADEQSLVKESVALIHLATYALTMKHSEQASRYINLALADANFFGARHRKMQILEILPFIEAQRLALEKSKRQQFIVFSIILAILLILAVFLLVRVFKQKEFITNQNKQIKQQNIDLTNKEATISEAYQKLERYAQELLEADKLKEQYIGFFFQSNTQLINQMKSLFEKSQKQIAESKFKEAIFTLKQFNPKYQKNKLLQDFDAAFLTVFPTFIEQMNLLFPETEQYKIPKKPILNTELRIFALTRFGISNNDMVAKILNYSVNTIYTYKTKIRNKSLLSNEAFDEAIRSISNGMRA
jgi:hypothetical protein